MICKKFWVMVFLLLCVSGSFAGITVTWNSPATGTTYSNNQANRETVDLNIAITDNNTSVQDLNLNIIYYPTHYFPYDGNVTYVVQDGNLFDWNVNSTNTRSCVGTSWANFTCVYRWTMPLDTVMPEGDYYVDANVADWTGGINTTNADANATIVLKINNSIGIGSQLRSIFVGGVVAAIGILLILGLMAGLVWRVEAKTIILFLATSLIMVGIIASLIGIILSTI